MREEEFGWWNGVKVLVRSRAGGPLPVSFAFFDGGGRGCGLQTFVEFLNNMSTLQYQLLNHGRIKHIKDRSKFAL